jgi:hypothetical protein
MTCKGICIHHKILGRYATGNKRCQIYEVFIEWDGVFCPCCGYRLRTRPRNMKFKAKLRKQKKIQDAKNKKNIMLSINTNSIN